MNAEPTTLVDLYLRLSVAKDGSDSLERQEDDLRAWAARVGLAVRRVWRDNGKSGYKKTVRRDEFDQAIAALLAGEITTLAVWKLDRLSRRGSGQIGTLLDDLEEAGGRLFFLMDSLDSSIPANRLPIILVSEQARAESANTSLRVRDRKAKDRDKGRYLGGLPPYGYEVTPDRRLRAAEPEFSTMREAVERVLSGDSLLTIVRDFNERGVPTRRGGAWRVNTLSASLRSPLLVGHGKAAPTEGRETNETLRDEHGEPVSLLAEGATPIATEAEQARLLAVMDARLRAYGRGRRPVRQPSSLLGGLLFCATCKGRAHTFGNSYRCRKWKANSSECAARLSVSEDVVEEAVRRAWAAKLASLSDEHGNPDSPILSVVARRWLEQNDPALLRDRADVLAEIDEARARMAKADTDHYDRGTLDAERHERVTAQLRERIARLQDRLADLPEPEADLGALLDPELSLSALREATVHEARVLLRLAITRIECLPAPKRGVRFNPVERLRFVWVGDDSAD